MTPHAAPGSIGPGRGLRRAGAVALLISAAFYLVAETVTAAAWTDPPYSYARNWVSDLGVPECGTYQERVICSPLHNLQNAGFLTEGVLLGFGAVVLALWFRGGIRVAAIVLALLTGSGEVVVGLTHGSSNAAADGSVVLHYIGAGFALLAPNLLAIVLGVHLVRRRVRGLGVSSLVLGTVGAVASLLLLLTFGGPTPAGVIERTAIYATIVWQVMGGVVLLHRDWAARPLH